MSGHKMFGISAAISGSLLLAVVSAIPAIPAQAQTGLGANAFWGTVSNIQGNCFSKAQARQHAPKPTCTFTVTTASASFNIQALTKTTLVAYSAAANVRGFINGDYIWVRGAATIPIIAGKVIYNPAGLPFPVPPSKARTTNAKFAGISTTTPPVLTVTTAASTTLTFTVAPSTKYRLNGKQAKAVVYKANDSLRIVSQLYTDSNQWTVSVWVTRKRKAK